MCKLSFLNANKPFFKLFFVLFFFAAQGVVWGQTDLEIHGTAYHNQNAGSITTFTLYVTNNGPDDATGVVVTDNLNTSWNFVTPASNHFTSHGTMAATGTQNRNITWTVGTIRNGETAALVFNVTNNYANWQIPSPFNNTNTATVTSSSSDPNTGNNTTPTITSVNDYGNDNLSITLDTTNANPIQGTNVTFSYTLNKVSGGAGTSIEVMGILPPGFTYVSSSTTTGSYNPSTDTWALGIDSNQSFPRLLTITATANAPGDYTNIAFISKASPDTAVTNNIASVSGTIQATNGNEADLTVTKTGARQNYSGGVATFNIAVTNGGPDEATDVVVSDFLDSGWSFPSPYDNYLVTEGNVIYTPGNKKFEWEIDSIPVGETVYFTYTVNNIGDGSNQHWDNTATASSAESDPNTSDNSSSITAANVNGGADIELIKNVTPDDPYIGENVVFTITAQRIESLSGGNSDATNIRVYDLLPSGYAYVSHTASTGTYDENTGVWTIGTINSDTARTLEITATALASGEYENNAVLFHDKPDPDVTNQIATATIEDPVPDPLGTDLSIAKEVDEDTPTVLTNVTFTLTATNNGNNNTTGVVVTDLLPSGYEYVSDDPSTGTYNDETGEWTIGNFNNSAVATIDIVAKVLETGNYTNTATIAGDGTDPNPANNTSEDVTVTPYFPSADLEITNMTINNPAPTVGNNVTFTIEIKNNGIDAASGVLVNALLPSGFQYVSSTPPAGTTYNSSTGVWTIGNMNVNATKSIQITAKVLGTGNYNFTAEIDGAIDDPDSDNNDGSATLTNMVNLAITKIVDEDEPGISDPVIFTIEVENVGTTDATGVVVKDVIPSGYNWISNSQGTYDSVTKTVTWNIGNLNASATTSFTITAATKASGNHTNTATVFADQPDDVDANNSASASVTPDLGDARDLKVVQSVNNETPNMGTNVTFTITATNEGPNVATGVFVNTLLGNGLEYVSNTAPTVGSFDSGTGVWTINGMANAATATLTITATVVDNMGAAYLSVAEITGNEIDFDDNIVNNKAYSILSPFGQTFYPCEVNAETPAFYEDFGSGDTPYGPELEAGRTNMVFITGVNIEDGEYTVAKNAQLGYDNWQDITDPSGDSDGYFMIVNADIDPYEFFRTRITLSEEFCTNTRYNIDFKMINVNSTTNYDYCSGDGGGYIEPEIGYFVVNDKGEILGAGTSGKIPYQAIAEWVPQNFVFISGTDDEWVELILFNKAPGGCGNDLAIDDISISACMTPPIRLEMEIDTEQEEVCGGETVTLQVDYQEDEEEGYVWPPTAWILDPEDEDVVEYQWQRSDDGINFTDITGEITDTYVIEDFQEEDQAYYRLMYAQEGNIDKVFCRFPSAQYYPVFNATPDIPPIKIENDGPSYICGEENIPNGTLQLYTDYDTSAYLDDEGNSTWGEDFYEWDSSDDAVATIDQDGLVTAVSTGITTITYTVTSPKGSCTSSITKDISVLAECPTCVEDPTSEIGGVTSTIGISTYEDQLPGWPENIPNGYIILESGSKGFIITHVINEEVITTPKEGMLIYDETGLDAENGCIKLFNGSEWHCIDQECDEGP